MTKLQTLRERRRLTQYQLAKISGVTQQAISKIETGECKNPGIKTLYRLSVSLKCTVDDLIDADDIAG